MNNTERWMASKFLKRVAVRLPILGDVIRDRDNLREQVAVAVRERNLIRAELESLRMSQSQGYCHCCRADTIFEIRGKWLRDEYLCTGCYSIPRQRHIQYVLDNFCPGWEDKKLHESSPSNDLIARYSSSYTYSHYFADVQGGSSVEGVRCENLEDLTFPDGTFDIFITQDVLEHVFNPERAVKEIMRVLKPGGVHVFTTPKHKNVKLSYPRAKYNGTKIQYLEEKMYHGNPVGDGRALVTWDYGADFEKLLSIWSGAHTTTYVTRDRQLGIDGEYIEVFVTRK